MASMESLFYNAHDRLRVLMSKSESLFEFLMNIYSFMYGVLQLLEENKNNPSFQINLNQCRLILCNLAYKEYCKKVNFQILVPNVFNPLITYNSYGLLPLKV